MLLALSVLLSCLMLITPAWAAREPRGVKKLKIMVLYSAAGHEVHAAGTVSGAGHGRALRARLQQRQGGRWVTRATGELKAHGQLSGYSLGWTGSAIGRREQMRVEVVSGRRVLGASAPRDVAAKSSVSVQSTLRSSTVQPTASQVVSVSGEPSGTMSVVLAKGARVPAVGAAIVLTPSAKTPTGALGVVTGTTGVAGGGTRVTTKPATLEDAYSSFEAHINGTLGELSEHAHETSELAHAAGVVNLDPFSDASFNCDNPSVKDSITHKIDLSDLQVNAEVDIPSWSNGFYGPGVLFSIGGQPKLGIGVKFTGDETCTAKTLADIPIPAAPGLDLEIGPDFTLHASGAVGVELEWTPRIFYGFSRFRGEPGNNWESFHNDGTTKFSGDADLTLGLALEAGLSLGGRVGIRGSLGPQIKGDVSAQSSPPQACLNVNADFAATLTAFANDFFNEYNFTIGSATFGNLQLYHACTSTGSGGSSGGSSEGSSGGSGGGGAGGSGGGSPGGGGGGALTGATQVATNGYTTCALVSGGDVDCWGTSVGSETAIPIAGVSGAVKVFANADYDICALLKTGHIKCWGVNGSGELGDDSTTNSSVPVEAVGINNATALSSGDVGTGKGDACALLKTGHIDCWGNNEDGELGNGTTTNSSVPVPVKTIENATQVESGSAETCALLETGTVDCWGTSIENVNDHITTPTPVEGVSGAIAISGERVFGKWCALLSNGGVDCWTLGQTATAVAGLTNAKQITTGERAACALLTTSEIMCWGNDNSGELGNGTLKSEAPSIVQGIDDATYVVTNGGQTSCALLTTGGVDCWGSNYLGALGNGEAAYSTTPQEVEGVTTAVQLEANSINAYDTPCVLMKNTEVECWGGPNEHSTARYTPTLIELSS